MTLEHATRLLVLLLYLSVVGMSVVAWRVSKYQERRRASAVIGVVAVLWAGLYLYFLSSSFHATSETLALVTRVVHYVSACGMFYLAWSIYDSEKLRSYSQQILLTLEADDD